MDYSYYIRNIDYEEAEQPEPAVCICPDYVGTTNVEFCPACNDWTDNVELKAETPYSKERAEENELLLRNFYYVLAETRAALARGRK